MFTIGQIEKMTGLSKDKLRYYEEKGILTPQYNEDNLYRYYDESDMLRVLAIEHYRFIDLGISDIKALNACDTPSAVASHLKVKEEALIIDIERLQRQLNRLKALIDKCDSVADHLGQWSIQPFGPYRQVGKLSDFDAYEEYEPVQRILRHGGETSILNSFVKQIQFSDTGLAGSQMLVVEVPTSIGGEGQTEVENTANDLYFDHCLYTVIEDQVGHEPPMSALFEEVQQKVAKDQLQLLGKAYLRMILMMPEANSTKSYLELFVPFLKKAY